MEEPVPTPLQELPDNALDHALRCVEYGWRITPPIPPGKKFPEGHLRWQEIATTDEATIRKWYDKNADHGVGVATGKESNLVVVDIDTGDGKSGDETFANLEAIHGQFPDTIEVVTGSGGRHLYCTYPDDVEVRSGSNVLGTFIDVRAEGGFVVAPPSIHASGDRYAWEASSPEAPADLPEWAIQSLRARPQDRPERSKIRAEVDPNDDRPGTIFEAQADWLEMLEFDGATFQGSYQQVDPDTGETWTEWKVCRPPMVGETQFDPHRSGTLNYRNTGKLYVFSTNWQGINPNTGETWVLDRDGLDGHGYDKFGYYAATRHGGDLGAAASELGGDPDHLDQLCSHFEAMSQKPLPTQADGASMLIEAPVAVPSHDDIPRPDFPVDALPSFAGEYVLDVAEELQLPIDLPGSVALGTMSAMVNISRFESQINGTWIEGSNLYLAAIAAPGIGKSPIFKLMTRPLEEVAIKAREESQKVVNEAKAELKVAESIAKKAMQNLTADSDAAKREQASKAALHVETLKSEMPKVRKMLVQDVTPEAFVDRLDASQTVALMSPEGGLFSAFSRYSDTGSANLDAVLQAWGGDTIRVDRKGGTDIEIINPSAVHCATIQPSVMSQVMGNREFAGRGLVDRFMFCMPPNNVGHRDVLNRRGVDPKLRDAWEQHLTAVHFNYGDGSRGVTTVEWTDEAADLLMGWHQALEYARGRGQKYEAIPGKVVKIVSSVIRTALIFHIIEGHSPKHPIGADVTQRAMEVGEYWLAYALFMEGAAQVSPVHDDCTRLMRWLTEEREAPHASFTLRDVMRSGCIKGKTSAKELEPIITQLIDLGQVVLPEGAEYPPRGKQCRIKFLVGNLEDMA